MRMALTEISPEDMAREPGDGWRSIESLLGEATNALRDTLVAIGHENLPEVPGGFEAALRAGVREQSWTKPSPT